MRIAIAVWLSHKHRPTDNCAVSITFLAWLHLFYNQIFFSWQLKYSRPRLASWRQIQQPKKRHLLNLVLVSDRTPRQIPRTSVEGRPGDSALVIRRHLPYRLAYNLKDHKKVKIARRQSKKTTKKREKAILFEKKRQNICKYQKNGIPLHSQSGNWLTLGRFASSAGRAHPF